MKLRTRFAMWVSLLLLAVLVAFGTFVYLAVANWLSGAVDDTLRLSATQVIETIDIEHGEIDLSDNPVTQDTSLADELRARGVSIQILTTTGETIKSFGPYRDLPPDAAAIQAALGGRPTLATRADPSGVGTIRVHTQAMLDQNRPIGITQISESLRATDDALRELMASFLFGAPVLVLAAGVGGYLLAGRALAPIDSITQTANRISAQDLSGRLNLPASNDEVGRLAATFDSMLGRLEAAFRRERQFTSDAAHQLRTPLAAMQTILGVTAQKQRTGPEYQAALADLGEETAQLSGLTEDLLSLARAEQNPPAVEEVDLGILLTDITESIRPLAEAKGLRLSCQVRRDLTIPGDTDALIRLFVNLLDNAVKYSGHGAIRVTASLDEGVARVVMEDSGRGISPEHLPHVFERFYRADPAGGVPGTGLGLAIAQEIARGHGGSIEVRSTPSKGSEFTICLPTSPALQHGTIDLPTGGRRSTPEIERDN